MITKSGSRRAAQRSADLHRHLFFRNQTLAEHLAAALWPNLILDVNPRDPGTFECADSPADIDRIAVTRNPHHR